MAGSTISTTITSTVQLGGPLYPSPLTVTSSGTIAPAAYGATGIIAAVADAKLFNMGSIAAGGGNEDGSNAGIGIDLSSGGDVLSNDGSITGGIANAFTNLSDPGGAGGIGVDIASGHILNNATIEGGAGGYALHASAGMGGAGITMTASSLANDGDTFGGTGGYGFNQGGLGGDGVDLAAGGGALVNNGVIDGGSGGSSYNNGGQGGAGVAMLSGGTLINGGSIDGGNGGTGIGAGGVGGTGGAGVDLATGELVNSGSITGGNTTYYSGYSVAGDGVDVGAGATLINRGSIGGGRVGGNPSAYSAANGAGVFIDGGSLTDFGLISGGGYGSAASGGAPAGDAVQFGALAGSLIIHPGARFQGDVAANPAVDDTLHLGAGSTGEPDGTLTGLGTQFTGFATVVEAPGATWTLAGQSTLAAGSLLHVDGTLTASGALSGAGDVLLGGSATLSVLSSLDVAAARFAPGADATLAVAAGATVTATLHGFGAGDIIDIGAAATTLTYLGGTLTLENGTTPVATFTLAGHYTQANFHLDPDQHGGTDISFVPSSAALPGPTPASVLPAGAAGSLPTLPAHADLFTAGHQHPA